MARFESTAGAAGARRAARSRRVRAALVPALVAGVVGAQGCGTDDPPRAGVPRPSAVPVRGIVSDLRFAPDGRLLAIGDRGLSEVNGAGRVGRGTGGGAAGAISPEARRVLTFAPAQDRASLVELASRRARWTIAVTPPQFEVPRAFWSADGLRLLIDTTDGPLRVVRAGSGEELRRLRSPASYLGRVPLSPDGRSVVVEDRRGVAIVDVATGRRRVIDAGAALDRPTWSPDGRLIAGGTSGIAIVDIASGAIRRLRAQSGRELAWSPDGRLIAAYGVSSPGGDDAVTVVDVTSGRARVVAHGASEERGELAWSADSRRLAFQSP